MKRHIHALVAAVFGVAAFASHVLAQEQQLAGPVRAITNIRGDLYRVQDDQYLTVFLVTSEGIVLADPLNVELARWLKNELAARFPNRPVRYVLHSHHAFDHAGGAWVFDDTAQVIGHDNFNDEVGRAARGQNSPVKAGELYRSVSPVRSTYRSRRTITLGGKSVELVHPGRAYTTDMTVLFFPAEHVVFAADYLPLTTQPFSFESSNPREVLASVRSIEGLDFDTFVSGHGEMGTKADVTALRQYLEELVPGVVAGFKARLTVDQLQTSLTLDKHQQSPSYAQRKVNIAEAYRALRLITTGIYGVAQVNRPQRVEYCTGPSFSCEDTGGLSFTGAAGMSVSGGPLAAAVEMSTGRQFTGSTRVWRSAAFEQTRERRDTLLSFLVRYNFNRNGSTTVGIGAGLSRVSARTRYTEIDYPSGSIGYRVARFEETRTAGFGPTVGMDVVASVGRRVSVILPVRLTHSKSDVFETGSRPPDLLGYWNFHAGVGLLVPLFRSVY